MENRMVDGGRRYHKPSPKYIHSGYEPEDPGMNDTNLDLSIKDSLSEPSIPNVLIVKEGVDVSKLVEWVGGEDLTAVLKAVDGKYLEAAVEEDDVDKAEKAKVYTEEEVKKAKSREILNFLEVASDKLDEGTVEKLQEIYTEIYIHNKL